MLNLSAQKERRASRRVPVKLGVVLYYNSLMLPECQLRDLTSDGAFIRTGGQFLPDRAQLDLAFNVKDEVVPQRFTAQVMRCTEEGVGVRLENTNPTSVRRLIETLYST